MILTALRFPLKLFPDSLHSSVWARVLTLALGHAGTRLSELDGRTVCLRVRDTDTRLHFRIDRGRVTSGWPGPAQVTIHGDLKDFLDLATRTEDPDALFFHRRLCIEGDTETGLHLKNILDALSYDWDARLRSLLQSPPARIPVALLRRLRDKRAH